MDFFEQQSKARRRTTLLVVYFALAVVGTVVAVYLAVSVVLYWGGQEHYTRVYAPARAYSWWNPELFLWVSAATLTVIGISSLVKRAELSQGGSAVATMLGGQLVNPNTTDPDERRLLNVVEEMAIASGTAVPQVYVLPDPSINAFAAGYSPSDAVIGVTRGCMRLLNRDELQGVIAHEFSHILNGDMRLNIKLISLVFGILGVATVGRLLLRTRTRGRGAGAVQLFGLLLFLIGSIGVFFGRLIQSAISREREHLADASAVQFTRNPSGLAGALKKIGGLIYGSEIESPHASEVCHIFFANGLRSSLFATHPPIEQRIRMLEPHWDGKFITIRQADTAARTTVTPVVETGRKPPVILFPQPAVGRQTPMVIRPEVFLPVLGNPTPRHIKYAADWRASLPPAVEEAVRSPIGASAVVFATLLSSDETVRRMQLERLARVVPRELHQETVRLWSDVTAAAAAAKLALVDLAMPGLRGLSPRQFVEFKQAVKTLIEADEEIDLFEFVLQKIVLRHLEPHFTGARRSPVQYYSLKPLVSDCAVLLSALAHIGHLNVEEARSAFELGWRQLQAQVTGLGLLPPEECNLEKVDGALSRLAQAVPQIKKRVLEACAYTVSADGVIKEHEAELLRAIADTLDCPVPPFVEGVQTAA